MGSSAGALVLAPAFQRTIDAFGWRGGYVAMGTLVVLAPIPVLLWALPRGRLRRRGESAPPARTRLELRREIRRPGLAPLAAIIILPGLVGFGVNVHLVSYLFDHGHTTAFAAAALGAAIGISAVGKLGGGNLEGRIGALETLRLALAVKLVAIAALPLASSSLVVGGFVTAWAWRRARRSQSSRSSRWPSSAARASRRCSASCSSSPRSRSAQPRSCPGSSPT